MLARRLAQEIPQNLVVELASLICIIQHQLRPLRTRWDVRRYFERYRLLLSVNALSCDLVYRIVQVSEMTVRRPLLANIFPGRERLHLVITPRDDHPWLHRTPRLFK